MAFPMRITTGPAEGRTRLVDYWRLFKLVRIAKKKNSFFRSIVTLVLVSAS